VPNLHGKPPKAELRKQIAAQKRASSIDRKELMQANRSHRLARAKIRELEARIAQMKQFMQAAIAEADREIGPAITKRYEEGFQADFERAATSVGLS
jgi:hypothetical protein